MHNAGSLRIIYSVRGFFLLIICFSLFFENLRIQAWEGNAVSQGGIMGEVKAPAAVKSSSATVQPSKNNSMDTQTQQQDETVQNELRNSTLPVPLPLRMCPACQKKGGLKKTGEESTIEPGSRTVHSPGNDSPHWVWVIRCKSCGDVTYESTPTSDFSNSTGGENAPSPPEVEGIACGACGARKLSIVDEYICTRCPAGPDVLSKNSETVSINKRARIVCTYCNHTFTSPVSPHPSLNIEQTYEKGILSELKKETLIRCPNCKAHIRVGDLIPALSLQEKALFCPFCRKRYIDGELVSIVARTGDILPPMSGSYEDNNPSEVVNVMQLNLTCERFRKLLDMKRLDGVRSMINLLINQKSAPAVFPEKKETNY